MGDGAPTAPVRNFRDLRVWQMAMDLVEQVYCLTALFPRQEQYGLASQVQRAAVSIPSNIAEGHSRHSTGEYLHHISFAQGSLAELQTQLGLARRLGYAAPDDLATAEQTADSLTRQLHSLRNALMAHHQ